MGDVDKARKRPAGKRAVAPASPALPLGAGPAAPSASLAASLRPQRPRDDLTKPLLKRALAEVYWPRPAPVMFESGKPLVKELFPFIRQTIGDHALTYLEFGVFRGKSIRRMAQLFGDPGARFFGFDSFEGLPEDWGGVKQSAFSTAGQLPEVNDSRIGFVKGYFQNSVPQFLAETRLTAPVLVNFDADLYSSTLFLLTTLWHHIPEYYFYFDEFWPDEATAFHDFAVSFPIEFEFLAGQPSPDNPRRHQHLFGRLRRTVYQAR